MRVRGGPRTDGKLQATVDVATPFRSKKTDRLTHFSADAWKERALYEQGVRLRLEHRLVGMHPELTSELAHLCGPSCDDGVGV
jgi:hypothetical protein